MTEPSGGTPSASSITIAETLALLDGPFDELAKGVAQNQYAFWLGSGISRGSMPDVKELIRIVLAYLQDHTNTGDANCPYCKSLNDILELIGVTEEERAGIDFTQDISDWPNIDGIVSRLTIQYARMLECIPAGESSDFLVWEALNVVSVFANPGVEPNIAHLCLAALILEGVATDLPSANWDGLVEKAVDTLSGGVPTLRVWVRGDEGRAPQLKAELYKFHGCAVMAGIDESNFRDRLIARASQINGWAARADNAVMANKLIEVATTKPTLLLGLSAQDSNIQGVFVAAEQRMSWPWPSHPPACVFSGNALGTDQQGLLANVYRNAYTGSDRQAINDLSLIKAYAQPLLSALWISVINSKLQVLAQCAPSSLSNAETTILKEGIKHLRDLAAEAGSRAGVEVFVREGLALARRLLSLFRDGQEPASGGPEYSALSAMPVQGIASDPSLSSTGLPELSIALGLLGLLQKDGVEIDVGNAGAPPLTVKGASNPAPLYFAANAQVVARLFGNGILSANDDAILVHSHQRPPTAKRSPEKDFGRTGKPSLREVSLTELLQSESETSALLRRFREEATI